MIDINDIKGYSAINILREYEGKNPYIKKLKKKRDDVSSRLYTIQESLREGLQGPKYEYMEKYIGKYVNNDYVKNMIKLSDILQIAIINGIIDRRKDFVIIFACRNPIVPLSAEASKLGSPRRFGDSLSQGGGGHTTIKHNRKKYGMNKGKNKNNKRKTIHRRKVCKSRKSRESHKSRKHSNSS